MSQVPYAELQRIVDRFLDEVAQVSRACRTCRSTCGSTRPRCASTINRDKLSDIGVSVDTVGRTLETMLGGRQVTRFKSDGEQYDVIVQVAPLDRTHAGRHQRHLRARRATASMVQLANLVDVREGVAPQSLNHFNRLRAVKVTGTLAPGYAIGEALKAMDDAAKRALPPTAQTDLDGQSREFRDVGRRDLLHVRAGADVHLPRAVGAVRELRRTVRDHAVGAAVDDRRAVRAVARPAARSTSTARSGS